MSHKILTDILRNDMGFEGVIVSDALDMAAITENFSDEDVHIVPDTALKSHSLRIAYREGNLYAPEDDTVYV